MMKDGVWVLAAMLAAVAGWTDWRSRRIPNWLTMSGLCVGIAANSLAWGLRGTTDALLGAVGVDAGYLAGGGSYFTVETHLSHLRQLEAGDRVYVTTQVLDSDDKRLHVFHVLLREGELTFPHRLANPAPVRCQTSTE